MEIRLQKVLASAGVASRRASEELIAAGRVRVNGRTVKELGTRVDPDTAVIEVDGEAISIFVPKVHLAMHKPEGVLSAMSDSEGRPHLGDYLATRSDRLFHVGRLDVETEGLILLTNDGELANRLAHPRYGIRKKYLVWVDGALPKDAKARLSAGIELEDGLARVDAFEVVEKDRTRSLVELEIHEGRNRIVRRIFDALGTPVERLVRTQVGPVQLGELRSGRTRVLTTVEVRKLMELVDL